MECAANRVLALAFLGCASCIVAETVAGFTVLLWFHAVQVGGLDNVAHSPLRWPAASVTLQLEAGRGESKSLSFAASW